jgi:glycosyltransferase involved in cell wall biosynthesis
MSAVVVLSAWQQGYYAERYPFVTDRLRIVRNGIALRDSSGEQEAFPDAQRPFGERVPRCIYSSSPDRGLDVLLELWPEIRRRVPGAELHVFYGWEVYDRFAERSHVLRGYKVLLYHLVDAAGGEAGGVFMRGRVSQPALHAEMQRARVWSYPTAFHETSCIGAMEARAAGLPIVTSDLAALSETVGRDHGILIPVKGGNRSSHYREAFVDAVVTLLLDEAAWTAQHHRALAGVADLDWAARAEEWDELLSQL